jgi:hypothetical protein
MVGWTKASTGSMHAGLFIMACTAAVAAVLILSGKLTFRKTPVQPVHHSQEFGR